MCWAAGDRLAKIATRLDLLDRAAVWAKEAKEIRIGILEAAWNERLNSLVSAFGGEDIDASLLCLLELGFLQADDPRFPGTLAQVERHLIPGRLLPRYAKQRSSVG